MTSSQSDITILPEGVRHWLAEQQDWQDIIAIEKIGVGQSNPTFIITTKRGAFILRSQPEGVLLPSAHAVDREHRIMAALAQTAIPVPQMHSLCTDNARYGVKFFLMEKVEGETLLDPALPALTPEARADFYRGQVKILADLATLDIEALGISDYGRPEGYLDRQIHIWTKQYRAAETAVIPAMEELIIALPGQFNDALNLPSCVVHGDFRQDNLIVETAPVPQIKAVIDWELSTLGPVFVDLSYWCAMLRMDHHWPIGGLGGIDRGCLNIPTEDALISLFCDATGLTKPQNWESWIAFQLFRFASILQGIKKRHLEGNASADNAEAVGNQAQPVAELAQRILNNAG